MTVLRQGVWLIGPCRTHAGRIDQLIVCLSFEEDQRRPRPPVALCLFLSIFFLPFFFHLLLLFPVCSFTAYLSAVGLSVLSRWIYCWHQKSLQAVSLSVKGLGHLKINVLASLTCPHAVANLYDFHSSVKQKTTFFFVEAALYELLMYGKEQHEPFFSISPFTLLTMNWIIWNYHVLVSPFQKINK